MEHRSGGPARFAITRWSLVLEAGGGSTPHAAAALATLCEIYWYPLYAYLRRRGYSAEDAQDLTQGFFARLLDKQTLEAARPERGRFRSFLLTSLQHYALNDWDRARAQKRGGGVPVLSLDFETAEGRYQMEPRDEVTPERLFDRRWALALLDRTLARLRAEWRSAGKEAVFEVLKPALTGDPDDDSYAQIGSRLGRTEGAVKVSVHRLRRRFRDLLREEIAETVDSANQIDEELRHLLTVVGR
jgi:RNA polymerase sigma-70 factor (ECF subfamily)